MNERDDISHRLRVSSLQARRELFEIERTALLREINSALAPQARKDEVLQRRLDLAEQCREITKQLTALGVAY
jgi:hypothetical protein